MSPTFYAIIGVGIFVCLGILFFSKNKKYLETAESILVAFILAMVIKTFVIQAFKIPSGSMIPTLNIGDRLIANKFIYRFTDPKQGDVIIFRSPTDPDKEFIKRLVGMPGDTIEIKQGKVYINNKVFTHPVVNDVHYTNIGILGKVGQKFKVPQDCYFVLGDNSPNSKDSRYWGFVPAEMVHGEALLVYWPLTKMRLIK